MAKSETPLMYSSTASGNPLIAALRANSPASARSAKGPTELNYNWMKNTVVKPMSRLAPTASEPVKESTQEPKLPFQKQIENIPVKKDTIATGGYWIDLGELGGWKWISGPPPSTMNNTVVNPVVKPAVVPGTASPAVVPGTASPADSPAPPPVKSNPSPPAPVASEVALPPNPPAQVVNPPVRGPDPEVDEYEDIEVDLGEFGGPQIYRIPRNRMEQPPPKIDTQMPSVSVNDYNLDDLLRGLY